jgi:hypothetical protein
VMKLSSNDHSMNGEVGVKTIIPPKPGPLDNNAFRLEQSLHCLFPHLQTKALNDFYL